MLLEVWPYANGQSCATIEIPETGEGIWEWPRTACLVILIEPSSARGWLEADERTASADALRPGSLSP